MNHHTVPQKRQKVSQGHPALTSLGTHEGRQTEWSSDSDDDVNLDNDVRLLDAVDSDMDIYGLVKAIRDIQAQWSLGLQPQFVMISHLYPYMKEKHGRMKTDVDVGLEELKKRHLVTILHMPGVRDVALLETQDYIQVIRRVASTCAENKSKTPVLVAKACEWLEDIVGTCCGPTFPVPTRHQSINGNSDHGAPQNNRTGTYIHVLLQNDLLLRIPRPGASGHDLPEVFGFKLPDSGEAVCSVVSGRNELLSKIKRKKNGEILVSKIHTIKLHKTILPIEWHVKDIIGSGLVHVIDTTVGPALRILQE